MQPLGNLYGAAAADAANARDAGGLGALGVLSDELILDILGRLDARTLARAGLASRVLHVFASHDELWRTLVLGEGGGASRGFRFRGTWRDTMAFQLAPARACIMVPRPVSGLYSEALFRPWFNASLALRPAWLRNETVPREDARVLSAADFRAKYELLNRPVILTHAMDGWPALHEWTPERLATIAGDALRFECGPALLTMAEYFAYASQAVEERPIYLFDPRFGEHVPALAERDYSVPPHFADDLFRVLGAARPNHRWLIAGPVRSGSSFHIDPNATSAWNAVITGAKKWILTPPGSPPPGVYPSADGAEVTAPVSIYEWFLAGFYDALCADARAGAAHPLEAVCRRGEIMFVPSGWWHAVINVPGADAVGDPVGQHTVVAITQNFVSRANLGRVCHFLARRREQVSGCGAAGATLYEDFTRRLAETMPDIEIPPLHATLWESVRSTPRDCAAAEDGNDGTEDGTFSFGFDD